MLLKMNIYPHAATHSLAAIESISQLETRPKKVEFLTDSLSVLQSIALGNAEDSALRNLVQNINHQLKQQQYSNGFLHLLDGMATKWQIN